MPEPRAIEGKNPENFEAFFKEYEFDRIHAEFSGRLVTLVIASLSLIAALAWDDALKHLFIVVFGGLTELGGQLIYALFVTLVAVVASAILGRKFLRKQRRKV